MQLVHRNLLMAETCSCKVSKIDFEFRYQVLENPRAQFSVLQNEATKLYTQDSDFCGVLAARP